MGKLSDNIHKLGKRSDCASAGEAAVQWELWSAQVALIHFWAFCGSDADPNFLKKIKNQVEDL